MTPISLLDESERPEQGRPKKAIDTSLSSEFGDLLSLAQLLCDVPFASLRLTAKAWRAVKGEHDPSLELAAPDDAFFISTVAAREPLWVPDVALDKRFNPQSIDLLAPDTRFYAGVPLIATSGVVLGALSIMACAPREVASAALSSLEKLGRQAVHLLEARIERQNKAASQGPMADNDAAQARYQYLFEASRDGILILNSASTAILEANPYFLSLVGYSLEEITGLSLSALTPKSDEVATRRAIDQMRQEEKGTSGRLRLLDKSGAVHEVGFESQVLSQGGEKVIHCVLRSTVDSALSAGGEQEFQGFLLGALDNLASQVISAMPDTKASKSATTSGSPAKLPIEDGDRLVEGGSPLTAVSRASGHWSKEANQVVQGIREVMSRRHQMPDENAESNLIEQRWFNAFVTYFMDAELMRIVMAHQDSAERQSAEKQIRFQSNLLDTVGEAVLATDLENRITYWNRPAETLFGWSSVEALGRDIATLAIPRRQRRQAREIREKVMQGESWTGDFTFQHRSGTRFSGLATNTPIYDEGVLVGIVGIVKDITERKRSESMLRESEERFRMLVDSVQDYALLLLDTEGYVTSWNSGAQRLKGYRADEIIGQHFSRFYMDEDIEAGKPPMELRVATAEGRFEEEG
ncbi:PAS domain S-box protein, partial [bacterium]